MLLAKADAQKGQASAKPCTTCHSFDKGGAAKVGPLGPVHGIAHRVSRVRNAGAAPNAFQTMCECYNQLGEMAGEMGFKAGLHNHMGQMVQNEDELDRCMQMTDPKLFWLSPDTAHLHLAGMDSAKILERYKSRLMLADYKDAKRGTGGFLQNIYDLGDGDVDFPACHRVLKAASLKLWLIVDLDIARKGPRVSYERCGAYVVNTLEPIYV